MAHITQPPEKKRSLPSIRTRLAMIVLACAIPAVAGFVLLINHFYERERTQLNLDTQLTARALVLAVDRDLNSSKIAVLALATSPNLIKHDWAAFHAQARSLLTADFPGANFVLSENGGQQIVNTLLPFGQTLPGRSNNGQSNLVFETGKPVISDVFIGGVMRRPLVAIHVPVWLDGKVAYALSVGILPERLGKILAEQRLPPDRIVSIFDSKGVIVARSHAPEQFVGKRGASILLERLPSGEGEVDATTLEGIPVNFNFSRSPASGWTVAIGVPRSAVFAELLQSVAWISAVVLALLAAGFALAWYLGGAISRSVKALAAPQGATEGARQPASMSFREADEVAAELADNRQRLENLLSERTVERDLLDQRVIERTRELRDTSDFNETILLRSPLPMGVYAADGSCVLANQAYAGLVGASNQALLAQNFHHIAAWQKSGLLDDCLAALANQTPMQREIHVVSSFGKDVWVACRIVPTQLKGEPHLLIQFFDLTERRMAENALRQSRQLLNSIVENIPAMIFVKRADDLRFEMLNRAGELLLGYSRQELIDKNDHDLFPREQADAFTAEDRQVLSSNEVKEIPQEPITTASGEVRYLYTKKIALRDETGRISHLLGVSLDISERKRAEEMLQVANARLAADMTALKQAEEAQRIAAAAFESHEAMMVTDADTMILRVNRAFTEATGYSSTDIVGRTPRALKSGRHDRVFYEAIWRSIQSTDSWQGEIWNRRKNGEIFPSWITITAVKGEDGKITHYVGTLADITLRKQTEDEIKHLAFFDALTGLPNRRLLMDRLRHSLASSARSGREGAVMFLDLDNFKSLNDTQGHDKGDLLLQQVAGRLCACVRDGDSVARLGGDEFVVLLEELSGDAREAANQAEQVGEKILAALNRPYDLAGLEHSSTPSIGVTLFGDQKHSIAELLKRADLAMYQAKAAGRNALRFFDSAIQEVVTAHVALDAEFRQGLQRKEFALHFQAQVDGEGRLTGVEALVRWLHPKRGMVPPIEFIPLAEETGLILPLGHWVLETACQQLVAWAAQPHTSKLTMAVNVSAVQFRRADYVEQVLGVLDRTGANPRRLKLEITESLLLHDVEDIIAKMSALQQHGVSFALDDFGTGYSSLTYLKRLPLDQLKIDRSFVRDVLIDPNDATIARAIVALGNSLGLTVIAEGVETEEQRQFLADHNCYAYQGYLFSRPLPLADLEQFMKTVRVKM